MAKKDKFAQLNKKDGGMSFQDSIARAAGTVAAIQEKNNEAAPKTASAKPSATKPTAPHTPKASSAEQEGGEQERYIHLPNPLIPVRYYNLASEYCSRFGNMTRQDWMELAIIEKLFHDGLIKEDEFTERCNEIRTRPPRGQRKNTKRHLNK